MNSPTFTRQGIREINFKLDEDEIAQIKSDWQLHVKNIGDYPPEKFQGRGIVMCAGRVKYFTNAWVAISHLRRLGCSLPIEIWYQGNELSPEVILNLKELNVVCKNFLDYGKNVLIGVSLKPLAITLSNFEEILFLDADNNCLYDPSCVFDNDEYLELGTIFWPDFWTTSVTNPIWAITENTDYQIPEQDSGQLLVNKKKCWKELNLCLYFNETNALYYKLLHGDKDTFKFAWHALKTPFYMVEKNVDVCGYINNNNEFRGITMVQYDPRGLPLFFHRNLLKWDLTTPTEKVWTKIKGFVTTPKSTEYTLALCSAGHYFVDLRGDVFEQECGTFIKEYEDQCLRILYDLRASRFYARFLIYSHICENRSKK